MTELGCKVKIVYITVQIIFAAGIQSKLMDVMQRIVAQHVAQAMKNRQG